MKNKVSVFSKVDQSTISTKLITIWDYFSTAPCPRSLEEYIVKIYLISQVYRNYANFYRDTLRVPVDNVYDSLSEMEQGLYWLTSKTNDVIEESRSLYILTRRQRRMLQRMQTKNEEIWFKFDEHLRMIGIANSELFTEGDSDFFSEEVPYRKDYSVILNNFQKCSFEKN